MNPRSAAVLGVGGNRLRQRCSMIQIKTSWKEIEWHGKEFIENESTVCCEDTHQ